jgi:cobalt-zinc-cadmium resistance protein CzcA
MHLDESLRSDIHSLAVLPVDVSGGGTVELGKIADFRSSERVTTIARSWGQRYSALSLFVKGQDIQNFVSEAQNKISGISLPQGYRLYWGGQFKNMMDAKRRLMILVPLTLLVVFLLLYKNFGSWREAAIVFAAIPFAMIGGVFGLWIRGMSMTVPASIGFIALAGIAVLNGVVMVTFISGLVQGGLDYKEAILRGARLRLRPVLMTALVASLGFIPMAFNTGIGSEVQRPLATVVIGGLLSATILTLIVIPLTYGLSLDFKKRGE